MISRPALISGQPYTAARHELLGGTARLPQGPVPRQQQNRARSTGGFSEHGDADTPPPAGPQPATPTQTSCRRPPTVPRSARRPLAAAAAPEADQACDSTAAFLADTALRTPRSPKRNNQKPWRPSSELACSICCSAPRGPSCEPLRPRFLWRLSGKVAAAEAQLPELPTTARRDGVRRSPRLKSRRVGIGRRVAESAEERLDR